jgi:hypothetical protein
MSPKTRLRLTLRALQPRLKRGARVTNYFDDRTFDMLDLTDWIATELGTTVPRVALAGCTVAPPSRRPSSARARSTNSTFSPQQTRCRALHNRRRRSRRVLALRFDAIQK